MNSGLDGLDILVLLIAGTAAYALLQQEGNKARAGIERAHAEQQRREWPEQAKRLNQPTDKKGA